MLNIRKVSIVSTLSVGLLVGLGYSTFSEVQRYHVFMTNKMHLRTNKGFLLVGNF